MVSSATRRILVTGANKGVGYAIVQRMLTDHDDTLCILGCRSRERGEAAVASLCAVQPAWRSRLLVCELDTSSDESVQTAAATVAQAFGASPPPLHGIVNNAGVAAGTLADVLNVNVRGPRRVDTAFIPLLCPDGGRIVQMGSGLGASCVSKCDEARQAFFLNPDVTWEQIDALMSEVLGYPAGEKELAAHGIGQNMGGYGLSKALLHSYTVCVAREHPSLKVNACSPGLIATDLFTDFAPWFLPTPVARLLVTTLMPRLMGAKTPDEGTVAAMYLLFSPTLEGNGRFYGSDAKRSPLDRYRRAGRDPPYEGP